MSVIGWADGFRLICNRDERRERPPAIPPSMHALGPRRAIFPVDPVGGGSWIGVNEAGLTAALLNRQRLPDRCRAEPAVSRGRVVTRVLRYDQLSEAAAAASQLDPRVFDPFRLLLITGEGALVLSSDGVRLETERWNLNRPLLLTSSSLGDTLVEGPRRALFERMVVSAVADDRADAQARFHRHQWKARPAISVSMARDDARTVSRTVVDVRAERIAMRYEALAP